MDVPNIICKKQNHLFLANNYSYENDFMIQLLHPGGTCIVVIKFSGKYAVTIIDMGFLDDKYMYF